MSDDEQNINFQYKLLNNKILFVDYIQIVVIQCVNCETTNFVFTGQQTTNDSDRMLLAYGEMIEIVDIPLYNIPYDFSIISYCQIWAVEDCSYHY